MASPIVKGQAFGATETVTAAKLQNIVDNAAFKDFDGSTEVFNVSGSTDIGTCVLAGGLAVKTSTGQLQLKSQADQTVIGNVSGGAAVPTAVPIVGADGILVNSDSLGTDDTKGATQGNIKAYVDGGGGFTPDAASLSGSTKSVTLPNGLIFKFGTKTGLTGQGDYTIDLSSESADFPNACLNASATAINADGGDAGANDYWMQVKSISSSEIVYVFQANSTPESGASFFWQAIGH
jgi:hypothetical protein